MSKFAYIAHIVCAWHRTRVCYCSMSWNYLTRLIRCRTQTPFRLPFDCALGPEGTPAQGSLRTNGSMVRYDHRCAVFPRSARKNRTPTEIEYRLCSPTEFAVHRGDPYLCSTTDRLLWTCRRRSRYDG